MIAASARDAGATFREVVTPEGLPLRFRIASAGERLGAFVLDVILVGVALVLLLLLVTVFALALALGTGGRGVGLALAAAIILFFVLRNFYFISFELKWQGSTPGKRVMGLRVIDARGGPLTGEAVFARNLVRELETFLPLVALLQAGQIWAGAPGWARLFAVAWLTVFALLPLLNRDRQRVGDLVAGTIVVRAPKAVLDEDVSGRRAPAPAYAFTREQLDLYGIYELQVLEGVLRQEGRESAAARRVVCEKIKTKIGWDRERGEVDPDVFLREFYTAQRARLEQKMLFGERQEQKRRGWLRRRGPDDDAIESRSPRR